MTSIGGPPPLPKLPVWDVVGQAYSDYFGNFTDVLRATWLWLVLGAAFYSLIYRSLLARLVATGFSSFPPAPFPPDLFATATRTMAPAMIVSTVILLLAPVSIAVAWHRRIILNERPPFCGVNIATGDFWRYIG